MRHEVEAISKARQYLNGKPVEIWLATRIARFAVDTDHHLIIAHEVTNSGSDRAQLANMAMQAKAVLGVNKLEAVADRGYYSGEEIKACEDADIAVTLPKPNTTGMEAEGRFGKQGSAIPA